MRYVNTAGLSLIKKYEGCRLESYQCQANKWTIGYGHTGPEVKPGMRITQTTAEQLMEKDVRKHADGIESAVKFPVTDNQWAAMVSLAFNIGVEAFRGSTLLQRLNAGDIVGAANEFLRWQFVKGKPDVGLLTRRNQERLLFLKGDPRVA